MKNINIFLLIIISLSVACASSKLSEIVDSEAQPSSSQSAQLTPTPLGTITITHNVTSPHLVSPIIEPIKTSQSSPIATVSSMEAVAIDNESELDDRRAVFPNTIIVYQKVSNDSQQKWTIYHTGRVVAGSGTEWQVQSGQVKPLLDLVESPDFRELDNEYAPNVECVNCLKQIVTVYYKGGIKEITIIDKFVDLPQHLKNVLDGLDKLSS